MPTYSEGLIMITDNFKTRVFFKKKKNTPLSFNFLKELLVVDLANIHTVVRPWARGEPPPHGSLSRRFLAIAIDLEGGRRTSAASPRKGIIETCFQFHLKTHLLLPGKNILPKQRISLYHGLLIIRKEYMW